ncbi:MFS transporter [Serratia marcescens]|uniref:MFS transporter n=1 Tax=Serratia marcescens TaxID=615 RepID=UPI00101F9B16|nr:MFS transporter [Serratia marcescens]RZA48129.1 MFS transporter [Serratia marcescens]
MSLVSQARSLGKYFLLLDNLLVVLGFFVVFPLISIRFVDQLGWAALIVGIALGLRQLLQQGLGIFGGAIADRFGAKPMIVTGMLLRAAGFATSLQGVFTLICCFYLGSIIAEPARETLSASLADPRARGSYMGFSRLGLALGGALGYTGGGWMYDTGRTMNMPELPWLLLGAVGFATLLALYWQFSPRRSASMMLRRG